MRAIRNGLHAAGIPVENSKGEWGRGQEEINVRYAPALDMADRHAILKNGCKEIAWAHGKAVTFMAKSDLWPGRQLGAYPPVAVVEGRQAGVVRRRQGRARHVGADAAATWPAFSAMRGRSPISWRLHQFLQALPGRNLRADPRGVELRQPHRRLQAVRRRQQGGARRMPGRGADLNPHLAFAALLAAGLDGIDDEMELEAHFEGDAYVGASCARFPRPCARR